MRIDINGKDDPMRPSRQEAEDDVAADLKREAADRAVYVQTPEAAAARLAALADGTEF